MGGLEVFSGVEASKRPDPVLAGSADYIILSADPLGLRRVGTILRLPVYRSTGIRGIGVQGQGGAAGLELWIVSVPEHCRSLQILPDPILSTINGCLGPGAWGLRPGSLRPGSLGLRLGSLNGFISN